MSVKQLSIFAENKNGSLYEITKILSDEGIDIRAFSVAETENFGVLRLIVCDPRAAAAALSAGGKIVDVTDVIGVQIPDTHGGLTGLLEVLTHEDVAVDYLYAFSAGMKDTANVVLRVSDNEKTESLLKRYGFELLTDEDLKA